MEIRGLPRSEPVDRKPVVTRRSCDHCRVRKIACDRISPCSNCISAKLECKHSPVVSKAATPKQRVLISAKYEEKIDSISEDVHDIKRLLQHRKEDSSRQHSRRVSNVHHNNIDTPAINISSLPQTSTRPREWSHSAHILDFLNSITNDNVLESASIETSELVFSVKNVLGQLNRTSTSTAFEPETDLPQIPAPPVEAVVSVLRWSKELSQTDFAPGTDRTQYGRIAWLSSILPQSRFLDMCQKVYFAVEQYTQVDAVLANGYLSHVFAEHAIMTGSQDSGRYHCVCRQLFRCTLGQLPLLLPATMETVAALTMGAYNATESSEVNVAWALITSASLYFQQLRPHSENPDHASARSLFWAIYRLEKGLALRLGRPSTIRDTEVSFPPSADEPSFVKVARIQGQVYDDLYSPTGLNRLSQDRYRTAEHLAAQLRDILTDAQSDIDNTTDAIQLLYLRSIQTCQSSLLVWILRVVPTISGLPTDKCISAAREVVDIHQQCMDTLRSCAVTDAYLVVKYINWAVLHVPFVPFSILFAHTLQMLDLADLDRLERFAASLGQFDSPSAGPTDPRSLYKLLAKVAKLYVQSRSTQMDVGAGFSFPVFGNIDFSGLGDIPEDGLGDWYYESQQLMGLLDSSGDGGTA